MLQKLLWVKTPDACINICKQKMDIYCSSLQILLCRFFQSALKLSHTFSRNTAFGYGMYRFPIKQSSVSGEASNHIGNLSTTIKLGILS